MPESSSSLPDFTRWPSFPFEGDLRVKHLAPPVEVEPPRSGEDAADCVACNTPDDAYIWVSERWRVRAMDRPTGLPMVLILECRSHLDLGDLPNLLAAELGVMTVRLERAVRSLDGVARVHVNRWGDGSAHLHMWFLARPYGRLQLRGTFLSLWDDILPVIPEEQWRGNLALVAAWLAEFGGRAIAEPPHIHWETPATFSDQVPADTASSEKAAVASDEGTNPSAEGAAKLPGEEAAASDEGTAESVHGAAGSGQGAPELSDGSAGSGHGAAESADGGAGFGEGAAESADGSAGFGEGAAGSGHGAAESTDGSAGFGEGAAGSGHGAAESANGSAALEEGAAGNEECATAAGNGAVASTDGAAAEARAAAPGKDFAADEGTDTTLEEDAEPTADLANRVSLTASGGPIASGASAVSGGAIAGDETVEGDGPAGAPSESAFGDATAADAHSAAVGEVEAVHGGGGIAEADAVLNADRAGQAAEARGGEHVGEELAALDDEGGGASERVVVDEKAATDDEMVDAADAVGGDEAVGGATGGGVVDSRGAGADVAKFEEKRVRTFDDGETRDLSAYARRLVSAGDDEADSTLSPATRVEVSGSADSGGGDRIDGDAAHEFIAGEDSAGDTSGESDAAREAAANGEAARDATANGGAAPDSSPPART